MSVISDQSPARRLDIVTAVKRAFLSALVAFGLFALLIGIRTKTGPTGALILEGRPETLALIVGVVFVGALVRELILGATSHSGNLSHPVC